MYHVTSLALFGAIASWANLLGRHATTTRCLVFIVLCGFFRSSSNKFQIGKCTFGEKCRYRHEIDPDYKKKDDVIVGKGNKDNNKDRNKNKDKNNDRKPSKDGHKLYTPNNYDN